MERTKGTVVGLFILGTVLLFLPSWSVAGPPVFGEGIGTQVNCKPGVTIGSKLGSLQPLRAHGVCVENLSITDTRVNITVIGDGYPGDGTIAPVGAVGGCGNDIQGLFANLAGSKGTVIFGADPTSGAVVSVRGKNILITDLEITGRRSDDPAMSTPITPPDWTGFCVPGSHAANDSNCNNTRGIQINRGGTLAVGRNLSLGAFAGTTDGRTFIEQTGVCIHDVGKRGVEAVGQAFYRITNSEIHHVAGTAVSVSEGSGADIGFDSGGHFTNQFASSFPGTGHSGPNFIHDNKNTGITIQHYSGARIYGNKLVANAKGALLVQGGSQADVGNNLLNGPGSFALSVADNSNVSLGTLFAAPVAPNNCVVDPPGGTCLGTTGAGVNAGTGANTIDTSTLPNSVTVKSTKSVVCGGGAGAPPKGGFATIHGVWSVGIDGTVGVNDLKTGAGAATDLSAACAATGTLGLQ